MDCLAGRGSLRVACPLSLAWPRWLPGPQPMWDLPGQSGLQGQGRTERRQWDSTWPTGQSPWADLEGCRGEGRAGASWGVGGMCAGPRL